MITRVWGIVNDTQVDFTPIEDKPNYWEGYAPKVDGLQDIEIWAENDKGARGHLKCSIHISYYTETEVRLMLCPFVVEVLQVYRQAVFKSIFDVEVIRKCRR